VFRRPSGEANGNTRDREGRLLSCEHRNRRVSRTDKDGRIVTLAFAYQNKRLNSPNDIVVKSDGAIYFTDPPYGLPNQTENKEQPVNGVYRLSQTGELTLLVSDFDRPNGIALSPDESRLYINDSNRAHIRVFDVRPDGTLANGRVFAELKDPNARGVPDGMKVDRAGNVYCTGAGGVWVIAPDGRILGRIDTPEVAANVGWGDRDGKTLFITASTGLYRIRTRIGGVPPGRR
jgi:gluconolactonase